MASRDVLALIPRTCGYGSLCGGRDFADVRLRWRDCLELFTWAQRSHTSLITERRRQRNWRQRKRCDDRSRFRARERDGGGGGI